MAAANEWKERYDTECAKNEALEIKVKNLEAEMRNRATWYGEEVAALSEAKATIIELRDALKEAEVSGEIALSIVGGASQHSFLAAIEIEKLRRKLAASEAKLGLLEDDFA